MVYSEINTTIFFAITKEIAYKLKKSAEISKTNIVYENIPF